MTDWLYIQPERDIVELCREQAELLYQSEVAAANGRIVPPIEETIYWQAADEIERLRGTLPTVTT